MQQTELRQRCAIHQHSGGGSRLIVIGSFVIVVERAVLECAEHSFDIALDGAEQIQPGLAFALVEHTALWNVNTHSGRRRRETDPCMFGGTEAAALVNISHLEQADVIRSTIEVESYHLKHTRQQRSAHE